MSETLFIRLGSTVEEKILWLIWSYEQNEIIASGELNHQELSELSEKSSSRKVTVLVPSCDVVLKRLTVPGNSPRAIKLAAPYMLEDDLAQDVDNLFFAYAQLSKDDEGHNCFLAAVEHQQMQRWQDWLVDAGIECHKMLPDVLAMPYDNEQYSAIALDQQIVIRQGQWQGLTLDNEAWPLVLAHWLKENPEQTFKSYSSLPSQENHQDIFNEQPEELPLALFAQHSATQNFNLLQGQYKRKEQRSYSLNAWLMVASIAAFALIFNMTIKGITLYQLNNKIDNIEAQIVKTYKQAYPKVKKVRINTLKSILNRKMAELGQNGSSEGLLMMLSKLKPAFSQVKDMTPESLKFDDKRNEVRIQASANNYQSFDAFKAAVEKEGLKVKIGSQSNKDNKIFGSLSIKG